MHAAAVLRGRVGFRPVRVRRGTDRSRGAPHALGPLASGGTYELQRFDAADCAGAATTVGDRDPRGNAEPRPIRRPFPAIPTRIEWTPRTTARRRSPIPVRTPARRPSSMPPTLSPCAGVGPALVLSHDPADASLPGVRSLSLRHRRLPRVTAQRRSTRRFLGMDSALGAPGGTAFTDPPVVRVRRLPRRHRRRLQQPSGMRTLPFSYKLRGCMGNIFFSDNAPRIPR